MHTVSEKSVQCGKCTLHYLEAGKADAPAVVLLHGMKFQAATWQQLGTLDYLATNGFRALALDCPGFGKSPACGASPTEVVDYFLKETECVRPVLLGPSMGGRICMEYGIAHGETLAGLILVGPVGVRANEHRLAELRVPTLVVWGGADAIAPVADGQLLEQKVEGAELLVIEKAPHPCYLDHAETFHQGILDFLKKRASWR